MSLSKLNLPHTAPKYAHFLAALSTPRELSFWITCCSDYIAALSGRLRWVQTLHMIEDSIRVDAFKILGAGYSVLSVRIYDVCV